MRPSAQITPYLVTWSSQVGRTPSTRDDWNEDLKTRIQMNGLAEGIVAALQAAKHRKGDTLHEICRLPNST